MCTDWERLLGCPLAGGLGMAVDVRFVKGRGYECHMCALWAIYSIYSGFRCEKNDLRDSIPHLITLMIIGVIRFG